jgi:hypothetical protein
MPDDDFLIGPELPEDGPPLRFAASGVPGGVADAVAMVFPRLSVGVAPLRVQSSGMGPGVGQADEHKRDPEAEGNTCPGQKLDVRMPDVEFSAQPFIPHRWELQ